MRNTEQNKAMAFHLQLLSKTIDMNQYPLTKMIIENNVDRKEYEELLQLAEKLHHQYMKQQEEGFLDFSSLLVQFAGSLNEKLDPNKTIYALKKEGYYPSLMTEFIKILAK